MVSPKKVEFLSIKEKPNGRFDLALKIENVKKHFDVEIFDRDGIFGMVFPTELNILLREFLMSHKEIATAVKPVYDELISNQQLQTAFNQ